MTPPFDTSCVRFGTLVWDTKPVQRDSGAEKEKPADESTGSGVLVVGHSPATDSSMNVRKTGCAYSCVPMRKV